MKKLSRLENALALLDLQSRRVIELWLKGKTSSDVAEEMALPERAIEVIRIRAIVKAREFISQQEPPEIVAFRDTTA